MKKVILILISILLVFSTMHVFAQKSSWVKHFGGTSYDLGKHLTTDNKGNLYLCGQFSGIEDVDPGPDVYNIDAQNGNIFICKLDSSGKFIWARNFAGLSPIASNPEWQYAITVDDSGYIYATGSFTGTADFDPGAAIYNLTASSYADVFLVKFDSSGKFVWAGNFGGTDITRSFSITTDIQGNVYTIGDFHGKADFNPGQGVADTFSLTSAGEADVFMSKLNSRGDFVWAKKIGSNYASEEGNSIVTDNFGHLIITGFYYELTDVDPGPGKYTIFPAVSGYPNVFICQFDTGGQFKWVKTWGTVEEDPLQTTIDSDGNIYTLGTFSSKIDFAGGHAYELTPRNNAHSVFISKVDSSGKFKWAKQLDANYGTGISLDSFRNIYVTGGFWDTCDFDPGSGTFHLISIGDPDIFICKLNSFGEFVWAKQVGGPQTDYSVSIAATSNNAVYVIGDFSDSASFNFNDANDYLASRGSDDIFLLKINQCRLFTSLSPVSCKEYISPSGKHKWTTSGIYTDVISTKENCDSIVTVHLTIPAIGTNIMQTGSTLIALDNKATYQWMYCDSTIIDGETSASFTAFKNGRYAVILSKNNCVDTSECFAITTVGIKKSPPEKNLKVFPNPTNGIVEIHSKNANIIKVTTKNILGELVSAQSCLSSDKLQVNLEGETNGIYFLEVRTAEGQVVNLKVIKQ